MLQAERKFVTSDEYFDMEEAAEYKSEYYRGEIFAMSGASHHHNLIAGNIFASLYNSLHDSDCVVYTGDMRKYRLKKLNIMYIPMSVLSAEILNLQKTGMILSQILLLSSKFFPNQQKAMTGEINSKVIVKSVHCAIISWLTSILVLLNISIKMKQADGRLMNLRT